MEQIPYSWTLTLSVWRSGHYKMSHHFGGLFLLISFIVGGYLSESLEVKALAQTECRIAGVVLVENEERSKFNYTMAESACQVLGLQLANKEQMERARGYGYETCSYGWIMEKVGAIPRIQNNENCGKNKTGVLIWTVKLSNTFNAYCFNVSDTRINSCKPGLMVTEPPSTVMVPTFPSTIKPTSASTMAPKFTSIVAPTSASTMVPKFASTVAPTRLKSETQTVSTLMPTIHIKTTAEASTRSPYTTLMSTAARTPPTTTLQTTPMEDNDPPKKKEKQMFQKNERLVFGGLPTTLLILALLFFLAAVVLAVCYVKRYKTHLLFATKKQKKESVETKVFKDTSGVENTKEEERCTDLQGVEGPRKFTGNSIEAEV